MLANVWREKGKIGSADKNSEMEALLKNQMRKFCEKVLALLILLGGRLDGHKKAAPMGFLATLLSSKAHFYMSKQNEMPHF